MTVKELIEYLSKCNGDLPVYKSGCCRTVPVNAPETSAATSYSGGDLYRLDCYGEGTHEQLREWACLDDDDRIFDAVII